MPAALVQSNSGGFGTDRGDRDVTTSAAGFTHDTVNHNLLLCVVYASNELVEGGGGCYTPTIAAPISVGYSTPWELAATSFFPVPPNSHDQFQSGAISLYYIVDAPVMAESVQTTVKVPTTGVGADSNTYVEFDLYEVSGVGPLSTAQITSAGAEGSPRTPNLLTSATSFVFNVMNSLYIWEENGHGTNGSASAGYTLGINAGHQFNDRGYNIVAQTQYILNEAEGSINTTWPITNIPNWCCLAAAFNVIVSGSASPSGVHITTAVGTPFPGFQGVNFRLSVGNTTTMASSNPVASSVGITMATGTTWGGLGLNYGNVVVGSSGLPLTVAPSNFYVRWTGYIYPYITGLYTIGVNSEDGCNLTIGTQLLINNINTIQEANNMLAYTQSAEISLTAGILYPIVLEWQHGIGPNYECQLIWTDPDGLTELIPTASLTGSAETITSMLAGNWWNLTIPLSQQQTQQINAQLKVRLTTSNAATTPVFTGASLDNQ